MRRLTGDRCMGYRGPARRLTRDRTDPRLVIVPLVGCWQFAFRGSASCPGAPLRRFPVEAPPETAAGRIERRFVTRGENAGWSEARVRRLLSSVPGLAGCPRGSSVPGASVHARTGRLTPFALATRRCSPRRDFSPDAGTPLKAASRSIRASRPWTRLPPYPGAWAVMSPPPPAAVGGARSGVGRKRPTATTRECGSARPTPRGQITRDEGRVRAPVRGFPPRPRGRVGAVPCHARASLRPRACVVDCSHACSRARVEPIAPREHVGARCASVLGGCVPRCTWPAGGRAGRARTRPRPTPRWRATARV